MTSHPTMTGLVGVACLLTVGGLVLAGSPCRATAQEPEPVWQLRLGAGAMVRPDYEGSDDYEITALPMINISYRDRVFLEGPMLGANLLNLKGPRPGDRLQAGPVLRYRMGRDQDDNDALRGLGDVDGSFEVGGFVNYGLGPLSAGLTVFQDAGDGHEGLTVELKGGYRHGFDENWSMRATVSATWADDSYTQSYFGIDAAQSLRSGYQEYGAEAGFKDVGLSLGLDYALSDSWAVSGQVGYTRLLGDAADSPIVADEGSANAFSAGIFVGYRF